jgi:hypothetical protein
MAPQDSGVILLPKKASKVKPEKRNMIQVIDWSDNEELFGDVVLIKPAPDLKEPKEPKDPKSSKKSKARYSAPPGVNGNFLQAVDFLIQMTPYVENIGLTENEYKKYVLNRLTKFIDTRVQPKSQASKKQGESGDHAKLSSFQLPRKAKNEYDKLYHKLKEEGNDMSLISYKEKQVSLLDSAKTVRMYFNTHNLKDADSKHIVLDKFTKELFKDHIEALYKANEGEFITQRQVQTLASCLVNKLK